MLQGEAAPSLPILDSIMLGLNGPELCKAVWASERPYVYITLPTASDQGGDAAQGFEGER